MRALEWKVSARADLLAIVDYISDDDPDAAQRLKDEIESKIAKLADRPIYIVGVEWKAQGKWLCGPITLSSMPRRRHR